MSWAPTFLEALKSTSVRMCFVVETLQTFTGEGLGRSVAFSSVPLAGAEPILAVNGLTFGGQSVSLRTWTYQAQSWSFSLVVDDETVGEVFAGLQRGVLVQLRGGPLGWDSAAWERLAAGRVAAISQSRPNLLTVEVWDLTSALFTRHTTNYAESQLFADAATASALNANYTAGDSSLVLTSASGFERRAGAAGAVRVSPATGEEFYLTYTGISGGATLTGVSATGAFGTTAVNAVSGDMAYSVAYLTAAPCTLVAELLTSTGTPSSNAAFDALPETWGYALTAYQLVDVDDIVYQWGNLVLVPASGSWTYLIHVDEAQEDGIAWMQELLTPIGGWVCMAGGRLSVRFAQSIRTRSGVKRHSGLSIEDSDVIEVEVEHYAGDTPSEYAVVNLQTATSLGSSGAKLQATTLPVEDAYTVDIAERVWANESAIQAEVLSRIAEWFQYVAEVVKVTLASCYWAQLVPGDVVDLTTRRARSRFRGHRRAIDQKQHMVLDVQPDWIQGVVRVSLAGLPDDDAEEAGL